MGLLGRTADSPTAKGRQEIKKELNLMRTLDEKTFPLDGLDSSQGQQPWLVLKFGGTSVSSLDRWQTIRDLVVERQEAAYKPVIVHSAVANVSNLLLEVLDHAVQGTYEDTLSEIVRIHVDLAQELGVDGESLLETHLRDLRKTLAGVRLVREVSPRVHVRVLSLGELMATVPAPKGARKQPSVTLFATMLLVRFRVALASVKVPTKTAAGA